MDSVRASVRAILHGITKVFPASRLFGMLFEVSVEGMTASPRPPGNPIAAIVTQLGWFGSGFEVQECPSA
jgi:hypothetical protein